MKKITYIRAPFGFFEDGGNRSFNLCSGLPWRSQKLFHLFLSSLFAKCIIFSDSNAFLVCFQHAHFDGSDLFLTLLSLEVVFSVFHVSFPFKIYWFSDVSISILAKVIIKSFLFFILVFYSHKTFYLQTNFFVTVGKIHRCAQGSPCNLIFKSTGRWCMKIQ